MPSVYISLMPATTGVDPRRLLPSVDQALQRPEVQALVGAHGRPAVVRALRSALDELRRRAAEEPAGLETAVAGLAGDVAARIEAAARPSLRRVLNATGVVVHTNLGRAPLSPEAAARVAEIASSYSNLEYDLERGERGDREAHAEARLRELARGRGDRGREQLRGGGAPRREHARRGARGPGEPRRAGRDRGLLPHPGRAPQGRRAPARGRDHQPDAPRRLPGRALPRHRHDPEGPPQQLPHRRLHGGAADRGARRSWRAGAGIPLVEDQGSGLLEALPGALAAEATVLRGPARRRRRRDLQRRQAARRPAGRPRGRARRPRRADAAQPALPRAARRQDDARRARRDPRRARERPRGDDASPSCACCTRRSPRCGRGPRPSRAPLPRPPPGSGRRSSRASPRWAAAPRPTVGVPTVAVALDPGARGPGPPGRGPARGRPAGRRARRRATASSWTCGRCTRTTRRRSSPPSSPPRADETARAPRARARPGRSGRRGPGGRPAGGARDLPRGRLAGLPGRRRRGPPRGPRPDRKRVGAPRRAPGALLLRARRAARARAGGRLRRGGPRHPGRRARLSRRQPAHRDPDHDRGPGEPPPLRLPDRGEAGTPRRAPGGPRRPPPPRGAAHGVEGADARAPPAPGGCDRRRLRGAAHAHRRRGGGEPHRRACRASATAASTTRSPRAPRSAPPAPARCSSPGPSPSRARRS